jgi:hypothetical protein
MAKDNSLTLPGNWDKNQAHLQVYMASEHMQAQYCVSSSLLVPAIDDT